MKLPSLCAYFILFVLYLSDNSARAWNSRGFQPGKLTEGIDKFSDDNTDNDIYFPPLDPKIGPDALFLLDDICIQKAFDRFEYTVCPFHNVTSKRISRY